MDVARAADATTPTESVAPLRVLLVEDDADDVLLCQETLRQSDLRFILVTAGTLQDAIERLDREGADVALVDLSLPDAEQLDAVVVLAHRFSQLAIVVMTGLRDEQTAARALHAGAQDYLIKGPGGRETIARAVRYAIERKRGEQTRRARDAAEAAKDRAEQTARELERNYRQLREQQDQTDAIIATATDAFVSIDASGIVTEWNRSAEELFGWSRREVLGRVLADTIVPEAYRQAHRDGLARLVAGGSPRLLGQRIELSAVRRDGTELPIELVAWRVRKGEDECFHAFIHDISDRLALQAERERIQIHTQRERLEAQLQQSQRLESLGQLAGGVAHDFNNLLAVMLNYTAFVAEQINRAAAADAAGPWESARLDIAQILRAGQRATELTRQLLAFGCREVVRPRVLDLNTVVCDVEQLLRRSLGEHIRLHTELAADLWLVLVDPGQLEQVLVNLAVNARDAMPGGGTLSIQTANRTLDQATAHAQPGLRPGRHIELHISDTGTGMPPEISRRVFEPFFTTKPRGEGSGLGLATVHGIITQAGGHVAISSTPGAGTTFAVLLPATDQSPMPVEETSPRQHRHGGETILVVEDEEALREVTRRILTRNGYHVLTAAAGSEALQAVGHTERDIHLLLTDVIMPGMLGKELATRMRELRPSVAVLYMSGYARPVLASRGTLDPGVILVEKPFSESTLLDQVREVLDRSTGGA